jgi:hypothetical protein
MTKLFTNVIKMINFIVYKSKHSFDYICKLKEENEGNL